MAQLTRWPVTLLDNADHEYKLNNSSFFNYGDIDMSFENILGQWDESFDLRDKALCIGGAQTISNSLSSLHGWSDGSHLHDGYIWPQIIKRECEIDTVVVAHPNPSVEFLCCLAFEAMSVQGLPKFLYIIFPDISTYWALTDSGKTDSILWNYENSTYYVAPREEKYQAASDADSKQFTYRSKKIKYDCTISNDIAIFNNFIAIDMLYSFCKSAGVKFRFLFETQISNEIMSQITYYREAFAQPFFADANTSIECARHSPQNGYQSSMWKHIQGSRSQIGIHKQIHFSEYLIGKIVSDKFLSCM